MTDLTTKLCYFASPYTHFEGGGSIGRENAFVDASQIAGRLIKQGLKIYSPIAHTHPIAEFGGLDPLDMAIWQPLNEAMLAACQVLIVAHMAGWEDSLGMAHEIKRAETWRMPVYDLDVETMELKLREKTGELIHATDY